MNLVLRRTCHLAQTDDNARISTGPLNDAVGKVLAIREMNLISIDTVIDETVRVFTTQRSHLDDGKLQTDPPESSGVVWRQRTRRRHDRNSMVFHELIQKRGIRTTNTSKMIEQRCPSPGTKAREDDSPQCPDR